jgi:uncharacterized protein (TIGR03435 family)
MTSFRPLVCLLVMSFVVLGFSRAAVAQKLPEFEVASIKPTPEGNIPGVGAAAAVGLRITGSNVRISGLSLKDYIGMAYSLEPPQVMAPEWAAQLRFDIAGNLPADGTREQIPQMLQALLADRFQLKVHKESREFPIFALVVGKGGLKIKGTPVDPNAPRPATVEAGGGGSAAGIVINLGQGTFTLASNKLEVKNLTMADLARALTRFAERKTIDATGNTDRFDFSLDLAQEDYQFALMRAAVNNGVVLPPQALRLLDSAPSNVLGQYIAKTGLELEERKAPLDVVVVDSVTREPKAN